MNDKLVIQLINRVEIKTYHVILYLNEW